ncbi:MAG: GNAT family N-acetyltransferase [Actinomycetota bacterium]|nr:GNAT family N-acetyltransferase [Actinomycetota bacterium]
MTQGSDLIELEASVDGTRLLFRPISPRDVPLIREGFERLSEESRYRRFFRHIDHLSEKELRYLTEVDFVDHVAWVVVAPDEPGRPGIGVARWIRIRDEPDVAEGAVTVIDDWQGRGIGKTLLVVLARSARARGIRAFRAWVLGENRPILSVLEDAGAQRGKWEQGVLQVDVPLPEDLTDLAATGAPLVLREVARGRLQAEARPEGGAGVRLAQGEGT